MSIAIIAAINAKRVIGKDNQLPWHISGDLKHFKKVTMGKSIVMGRKTFESIGKPLPGRQNIILTRDDTYQAAGCEVVHSVEAALTASRSDDVMVIGGAQLYALMLPLADTLHLTLVDIDVIGDTFFPEWQPDDWKEVSRDVHPVGKEFPHACQFVTLTRC